LPGFDDSAFAASHTLRLDSDSNSRIVLENSLVTGNETTLLFWTWPDIRDPNSGKECPLNFYSVTLQPGLESVQPKAVAREVCGGIVAKGGLLETGDGLIIARDRLERWRDGEKISSESFSSFDATRKLRVTTGDYGAQFWDVSHSGNIVIASPVGGHAAKDWPGASLVMTSLEADGKERWQLSFSDVGETFTIERLWAANDGGALLHIAAQDTGSMIPLIEPQLRFFSSTGKQSSFKLIDSERPFDITSVRSGSQEDLERFYAHQRNAKPESIEAVAARPRESGGFDVLFHRSGGAGGRSGHFLYQIGADGSLQSDVALGGHIEEHGLDDWVDFYVSGHQLVLLSRVMATQSGVKSRRKQWMQNVVSWINLDSGAPFSRLIPLDTRYLEAAMNAGDEGQQYLDGQPGGKPVMLTTVRGMPLAVSIGYIKGRNTLRLNEAVEDLLVFTETYDQRQQQIAKERSSQQRKADREARKQQMNAALASSVGMTPDEFAALSNSERKKIMIRQGDPAAMQAMMEKQALAAQQSTASQPPGPSTGDMNAQIAEAMAQAQAEIANNPNVTPEMRAQMAAVMAQMGQAGGQGPASSGMSSARTSGAAGAASPAPAAEKILKLDASQRAFLDYENDDGHSMSLLIYNRETGRELLKKDYPDGTIYEYIDFSRFSLPLEQIGVTYSETGGDTLRDLTPALAP